ncbi:MAG TPA: PDC sensor domain-containing protein, partial [Pirellulales bacterium]|nr:PDC sensor domain-containing protein [Pirellulales bacterium]
MKLTVFVAVLVVVTAGILGGAGYKFTRDVVIDQIRDRLNVVAASRQAAVLSHVRQQEDRVQYLGTRTRVRYVTSAIASGRSGDRQSRSEMQRWLTELPESMPTYRLILVADTRGNVVASS